MHEMKVNTKLKNAELKRFSKVEIHRLLLMTNLSCNFIYV